MAAAVQSTSAAVEEHRGATRRQRTPTLFGGGERCRAKHHRKRSRAAESHTMRSSDAARHAPATSCGVCATVWELRFPHRNGSPSSPLRATCLRAGSCRSKPCWRRQGGSLRALDEEAASGVPLVPRGVRQGRPSQPREQGGARESQPPEVLGASRCSARACETLGSPARRCQEGAGSTAPHFGEE